MWLSIIYLIPSEIYQWYRRDESLKILQIAVYILIPVSWLILIIESEFCGEMQYLKNLSNVSNTASFVRIMRSTRPLIEFHVQCYHYETRVRNVTVTTTNAQV